MRTREALESLLDHFLEAAKMFSNEDENKMDILCLLFRLGRHEEFYNLAKAHIQGSSEPIQVWIDRKDDSVNPWENGEWMLRESPLSIDIVALIFLLKLKMMHDLVAVENAISTVGCKVSRELFDHILSYILSTSIVANDLKIFGLRDNTDKITILHTQVEELHGAMSTKYPGIWKSLLPGAPKVAGQDHRDVLSEVQPLCSQYPTLYWAADPWAGEYITKLQALLISST